MASELEELLRAHDYNTSKLQEKCDSCGKVAKEKSKKQVSTSQGDMIIVTLECNHFIFKPVPKSSKFEDLTFDGLKDCKHNWNKTICLLCGAKKLYPFQILGAKAIEAANGRFAIFDEMGLGKTIQALAYLKYHLHDAFPYLWVTKSGIKFQHAKEIVRVLGKEHFPQIFMTGKDTPIKGFSGYLIGYDLFRRLDLNMFDELGIKTVILDECQAIKNPDSSRTQAIRAVVREIPKIIPLSGTPWKNRGSEFFVTLNLLDSRQFYSLQSFKDKWVKEYWDGNKRKEGGINNPVKFKESTKHILIRRERTEVMPELPLVNRTRLLCEVPEWARNAYNKEKEKLKQIHNDAVLEGEESSFENKRKENEILMVMKQIVGIAKVPQTVEFAQEFLEETDRKLIIFIHHKECSKQINEQMSSWCLENKISKPLVLTADLDSAQRFEVQEQFNNDNRYRLLIASTLASGEGLNLQKSCSDLMMHERQWNPANEEQAEGRLIRIGQTAQSINATYVHADQTVDTILDEIVEKKRIAFHLAMNKGEMPTWNEADLRQNIIERIINQ